MDMKKADYLQWITKKDLLVSCYRSYVTSVCGYGFQSAEDGGKGHAAKWNEFKALLESWSTLGANFSLHY